MIREKLIKFVKAFIFLAFVGGTANIWSEEFEALLWMVDDPIVYDNGVEKSIATYESPDGLKITHARVAAISNIDGAVIYLNMAAEDDAGEIVLTPATFAKITEDYRVGPVWSAFLEDEESEISFAMEDFSYRLELGKKTGTEWQTLAMSETASYGDLADHIAAASIDIPTYWQWVPNVYTTTSVPEPSSVLMLLLGCAMLTLRRRVEK